MSDFKKRSRSMVRDVFWQDRDREGYECTDCGRGAGEVSGSFEVHHKDGNPYNNNPENLVGLCKACHALREDRRPSKDSLRRIMEQFQKGQHDTTVTDDQLFLGVEEIVKSLPTGSVGMYASNSGQINLAEKLGYESEYHALSEQPRTRREAAIFQAGFDAALKKVWEDAIEPVADEAQDRAECALCGSDSRVHVQPDATYGELDDRLPFCKECSEGPLFDELESGHISFDDVAKKMWSLVNQQASSDGTEGDSLKKCEMCGKERENQVHVIHDDGTQTPICRRCGVKHAFGQGKSQTETLVD